MQQEFTPNTSEVTDNLVELLAQIVVGQPAAMKFIVPYVYMYQAGLAPEGRPAGVEPEAGGGSRQDHA